MHNLKVDSPEGIKRLMDWARATGAVLSQGHASIAKRYDVSTDGVKFVQRISMPRKPRVYSKYDPSVKTCFHCYRIVANATRVCPGCNYEFYPSRKVK